jgi:hypothetical protein
MRITRLWKRLSRSIAPDPTSPLGVATERVGQEIGRTSVFAQSEDDTLALTVPVLGAPGKPHALDTAVTFRVFSGTSGTIPAPPAAQELARCHYELPPQVPHFLAVLALVRKRQM